MGPPSLASKSVVWGAPRVTRKVLPDVDPLAWRQRLSFIARFCLAFGGFMPTVQTVHIHELMTRSPRTITAGTTIGEALQMMRTLNVSHLPVTNDEGGLVGLVSDTDLPTRSILPRRGELSGTPSAGLAAPVSTIMTAAGIGVEANEDIEEAIDVMMESRMTTLPIIDRDGGVVGIVSYLDVMKSLPA
jgi:CBS domain-containing membrane protein